MLRGIGVHKPAVLPLFYFFFYGLLLCGQTRNGSLTGTLTDTSGGVLQGAQLQLTPANAKAVTDRQGVYNFADVPAGTYVLHISVIGFNPASNTVMIKPGETAHSDAVLTVASAAQQVIVTESRPRGEAAAINRQRTAENILQVLPAEVIRSLPNANVADAIGRLPSVTLERDEGEGKYVQIRGAEPRYSNVTIDGVNVPSPESGPRQIKLDVIPSDLVESVEISKTLIASQDGDAIGGSVNLRTKTAGEQPTLSVFGIGGFTPIFNTRGVSQFGATIGQRFGRDRKLGLLFGGTYDWNGRGINDVEPAPQTIPCDSGNCTKPSASAPSFGTYAGLDLRDYRYYRTRFGFEGSVDYKFNDASSIYLRGLYSHFDNYGDRWVYSPAINSYTTSALQGGTDGSISSNASIRRPVQVIGSMVAGGRQSWGASTLTWEISAARSSTEDKGYSQANFAPSDASALNSIQYAVDLSNPYRPKLLPQNGVNVYDPSQYVLSGKRALDINHTYSPQLNLAGSAAYSRGYNLAGHLGTFEFGGKFRNAHKFQESNDIYYDTANHAVIPMSQFLGPLTDVNYYDGSYRQGPFVDYGKVTSFFYGNPGLFSVNTNTTKQRNDPNNYDLVERVAAGYLMNTIEVGKWRVYGGVRFESTNEDVLGRRVQFDSDGNYLSTTGTNQTSNYLNVLPSAELRYAITQDSAVRFDFGKGISRPNYGDLPPYLFVDDSNHRVSAGNPNLVATRSNNYDVLYEHYLNPLGVIQGGLFYKDIKLPIYSLTRSVVGVYAPDSTTYAVTQPVNGTSAWIAGLEISIQQRLSYLPGLLNGLGISANYSYTNSRANGLAQYLGRTDHPHLQRQAPHTWNISPTYDKWRISLRVGISYNAANIFSYNYASGAPLGLTGPNGDQYLYSHLQIDAQSSVRLAHGFSGIVYGLNLNNEVFGFYQGSGIWPIQREYYKPTFGFGLRWEPVREGS